MTQVAHGKAMDEPQAATRQILMASTSYPSSPVDWKGLFIQRLVGALAERRDTSLELWAPPGPVPSAVSMAWRADDAAWLQRLMERGGIVHLLRERPMLGLPGAGGLMYRLGRAYRQSRAHLFHVNWLQNALPLPGDHRPALVTALGSDMPLLRLPMMRHLLRRAFTGRRVTLCPNADWMVPTLEAAFGDVAEVRCVPFGIDASWYRVARGLHTGGAHRWLCVTRLTAAKLGHLFEWCEPHFARRGRELHLFGPRQEEGIRVPAWVHFHGPATPDQLRTEWFPQATGLISLSRHAEGRPQVMLEAMAAGLPILASRLPAHEDIIQHAATGWLCDDPAGMAPGIDMIEDRSSNAGMGARARGLARSRFGDWDDCGARYAAVHNQLTQDRHG